jgi:hypothetical protein
MIFLVLLVVALYAVATAFGWGPHGGLAGCMPSEARRRAWKAKLGPSGVDESTLGLAGCTRSGGRLRFQGACKITVPRIEAGARRLKLLPATTFELVFQPNGNDGVEMKPKVKVGKELELTIPKEGATVALECTAGANGCLAQME